MKRTLDVTVQSTDLRVVVTYEIKNDGIGAYEFWGFPGYDKGADFVDIEKIIPEAPDGDDDALIRDNYEYLQEQISDIIMESNF